MTQEQGFSMARTTTALVALYLMVLLPSVHLHESKEQNQLQEEDLFEDDDHIFCQIKYENFTVCKNKCPEYTRCELATEKEEICNFPEEYTPYVCKPYTCDPSIGNEGSMCPAGTTCEAYFSDESVNVTISECSPTLFTCDPIKDKKCQDNEGCVAVEKGMKICIQNEDEHDGFYEDEDDYEDDADYEEEYGLYGSKMKGIYDSCPRLNMGKCEKGSANGRERRDTKAAARRRMIADVVKRQRVALRKQALNALKARKKVKAQFKLADRRRAAAIRRSFSLHMRKIRAMPAQRRAKALHRYRVAKAAGAKKRAAARRLTMQRRRTHMQRIIQRQKTTAMKAKQRMGQLRAKLSG